MIDLHLHSNCSDGKLSVKKLAEKIINSNIKYCSLTDHNTVSGQRGFSACLLTTNIRMLMGVELTALYKDQEVHILAYNFDLQAAEKILEERNKIVSQQKITELELAKKLFIKCGYKVSRDLVFDLQKPVGYTVAMDVQNNVSNQKKLNEVFGHTPSAREFYDYYQTPGKSCFTKRSGVTIKWLLDKFLPITEDIVLAHPLHEASFPVKALTFKEIEEIIELGVKGIEIYHPFLTKEQIQELEEFANENKILFTGGSDFHKEEDSKIGYYDTDKEIKMFKLNKHKFGC